MAKRRCAPAATELSVLSDDIILEILQHLPIKERLMVVPCVCKRWQCLHSKPSKMWRSLCWDCTMPTGGNEGDQDRLLSHMRFLRQRLASLQDFEIRWLLAEAETSRHLKLQTCLTLLAAAPDLRTLDVAGLDLPLQHASFVRMCSGLRYLEYRSVQPEPGATTAGQLIEPLVQGLYSLKDLFITFNGVGTIKAQGFATVLSTLTTLRQLFITVRHVPDMLQFGSLPAALFRACSSLRTLSLNNCGVRDLPAEITCASELTSLQLLSAKPSQGAPPPHVSLPLHITKLQSLVELDLSSACGLQPAIFGLTNLTGLTLDQLALAPEVGAQLRRLLLLPKLKYLRLCNSGQLAAAMTNGLGGDSDGLSICHVCLDGNGLTSTQLPHVLSWFKLGALELLDLRYNSLSELPKEVVQMTALRKLDVSWNPPLKMKRSDAQLFAGLAHFQRLVIRAWDTYIWNKTEAQIMLDIKQQFVRPTARLTLCRWENDEDGTWDNELDDAAEFLTEEVNRPPRINNIGYVVPG